MERNDGNKVNEVSSTETASVNRSYKDSLFRMLHKERKELLELYNAVNDTDYTNPDELTITTLENAIYMNMKNDVSCLLDMRLQLFEHQSTVNPNMPLRDLMHVSRQFQRLVAEKDIYSSKLIPLPTPKFFVFYNGRAEQPERVEYKLSDAFEIKEENPALELVVIQLNINTGFNEALKEKCPTLWGYMHLVNKIRRYEGEMGKDEAVRRAVDECIEEGVLRDFLLKNKSEVVAMCIFEYNEELHEKTLLEIGEERGIQIGEERGIQIGEERGIQIGEERGIQIGEERGIQIGEERVKKIFQLYLQGKSVKEIASACEVYEEKVQEVLSGL